MGIGSLLQPRIDGRAYTPNVKDLPEKPADPSIKIPKDTVIIDATSKPISLHREMKHDPKRMAVRIMDVLTNMESQERSVRVEYSTALGQRGSVKFNGVLSDNGESREYGNGVPDNTVAAIVLAESKDTPAVPLFVWGQPDAKWQMSVSDVSSSVRIYYDGTIPAGGKAVLIHWVATAGLEKGRKLEKTFELFWKDQALVDPEVPDDLKPFVVNFSAQAMAGSAKQSTSESSNGRLALLDTLCDRIGLVRNGSDNLWMGKDEIISGKASAVTVKIKSSNVDVTVPFAEVAALRGGAGKGREHRLYLRDGSVLAGKVTLEKGALKGDLGYITLNPDGLDLLVCHRDPSDGKAPVESKAFLQTAAGELWWLAAMPQVAVVTPFGKLQFPGTVISSCERRTEAPFGLAMKLADGSLIHGVLAGDSLALERPKLGPGTVRAAEIVRLGEPKVLSETTPATPDAAGSVQSCALRDGSSLRGKIVTPELNFRSSNGLMKVKSADISRLSQDQENPGACAVELTSGSKLKAELVDDVLIWSLGSQEVALPVGLISEVTLRGSASAKNPEASSGDAASKDGDKSQTPADPFPQ